MARRKPKLGHIAEGLRSLAVSVSELRADPNNARRHSDRNVEAIKASLRRFGQRLPLIAREGGVIVAGNGRLKAAQALGWKEVAVVYVDDDPSKAAAFAIADNRTAELATWDGATLAATLQTLTEEDLDLVDLGWTSAELDALIGDRLPLEPAATLSMTSSNSSTDAPSDGDPLGQVDEPASTEGESRGFDLEGCVVVECGSAEAAEQLIERLKSEGLAARLAGSARFG